MMGSSPKSRSAYSQGAKINSLPCRLTMPSFVTERIAVRAVQVQEDCPLLPAFPVSLFFTITDTSLLGTLSSISLLHPEWVDHARTTLLC
jgi:hypothetical protein